MAVTATAERNDDKGSGRRDNRRPQLLDAAAKRFCQQGYDAASMREIAGDAGMLAGSIYYYFPSKEDLLVAVHEEGVRRITRAVERALEAVEGPWSRLEAAMVAHLSTLLDGGEYAQVVIRELPRGAGTMRGKLVRLRDGYEETFRRLIDALPLPKSASRKHLRLLVMGALNWSQTWYQPDGDKPETIARHFVGFVRQGVDGGVPGPATDS